MKYFYIIIFISGLLLSQSRIQEWKAYTSPLHINDLTEYNDLIICATNGGLLLYDKNKKNFTTLTVVDQLVSTGVNIIEVETADEMFKATQKNYIWSMEAFKNCVDTYLEMHC